MIVKCDGLKIGKFLIPAFELNKGEIIELYLYSGAHFYDLEMELVKIFTGQKAHENVKLNESLKFVEHFKESRIHSLLFPTTVRKYLNQKGRRNAEELERIYDVDYIKPNTRIITLAGDPRKWLSLWATLSHSDKIIFDLAGLDPLGAEKTLNYIREYTGKGGAALLLAHFDKFETECSKYYRIEIDERLA